MKKMEISLIVNTRLDNNVGRRVKRLIRAVSGLAPEIDIHYAYLNEEKMSEKIVNMVKLLFSRVKIIHIFEPFVISLIFILPFRLLGKRIIYQTGDVHYKNAELMGQTSVLLSLLKFSEKCHYYLSNEILVGSIGHKNFLHSVLGIEISKIKRVNYFGCSDADEDKHLNANRSVKHDSLTYTLRKETSGKFVFAFSASLRVLKIGNNYVPRGWEIPFVVNHLVNEWQDNVVALILGDGPGKRLIEALSSKLGVKNRVFTIGNVDRKDYFDVLDIASLFIVESLDHVTYSIMDPTKISDYVHVGKPFIWSFNPESMSWKDYPLLVKPAKFIESFFDLNVKYINDISELKHRYINDNSFHSLCLSNFDNIKNNFPKCVELAEDVATEYRTLFRKTWRNNLIKKENKG